MKIGGKTNQLKNFAMDVWLKHWPSWQYPLLMFYIMIWNPPTKARRHFFLNELETSWDVSTFVAQRPKRSAGWGGLPTLKSWPWPLRSIKTNISKLNLSMIFFSRHEFWEILDFKMYSQPVVFCLLHKKRGHNNVFQLPCRETPPKKKKHRSVEYKKSVLVTSQWKFQGAFQTNTHDDRNIYQTQTQRKHTYHECSTQLKRGRQQRMGAHSTSREHGLCSHQQEAQRGS